MAGTGIGLGIPVKIPLSGVGTQAGTGIGMSLPGETYQEPAPSYYQDPGAGYDTGGYAAAPAPRMLATSPEWLAYLNALGMQEQSARADMDKTRGLYESDAQRQLADLPAGYIAQRRGLSGSLEARGMSRSGEKLRRMAENRANQGRAESGVRAQLGFQVGSLESALANKLMDLNQARASQEMNLRAQGYV
jgi:hypothetical protein